MRPIVVTAKLGGVGVMGDGFFPLDGLLSYAVHCEMGRPQVEEAPAVDCLERRGEGEDWYYAASFAVAEWKGEGKSFWVKRPRYSEYITRSEAKSVTVNSGQFKGYNMPVFYLLADEIRWYCVGEPALILDLLSTHVGSVGKKRSQGWGLVSAWTVEPHDEDWSEVRDGVVTRALPAVVARDRGLDGDPGWYGVKPAYWDVRNQGDVFLPPGKPTT
jgi:CRISPR type IV-associated protein Csf3